MIIVMRERQIEVPVFYMSVKIEQLIYKLLLESNLDIDHLYILLIHLGVAQSFGYYSFIWILRIHLDIANSFVYF